MEKMNISKRMKQIMQKEIARQIVMHNRKMELEGKKHLMIATKKTNTPSSQE